MEPNADGTLKASQVSFLRDYIMKQIQKEKARTVNSQSMRSVASGHRSHMLNETAGSSCSANSQADCTNLAKSEAESLASINSRGSELAAFAKANHMGEVPCVTNNFSAGVSVLGPLAKGQIGDDTSIGCNQTAIAISGLYGMSNAIASQVSCSSVQNTINDRTSVTNQVRIKVDEMKNCTLKALQKINASIKLNLSASVKSQVQSLMQQHLSAMLSNLQEAKQERATSGVGGTATQGQTSAQGNTSFNAQGACSKHADEAHTAIDTAVSMSFTNDFELDIGSCKNSSIEVMQTQDLAISQVLSNTIHNALVSTSSQELKNLILNAQKTFQKSTAKGAFQGLGGMGGLIGIIAGVVALIAIIIGVVIAVRKRKKTGVKVTTTTTTTNEASDDATAKETKTGKKKADAKETKKAPAKKKKQAGAVLL